MLFLHIYSFLHLLGIKQVPVVMCPEDGCFPGLYCFKLLSEPWLSDRHTMVLSSIWGSVQTILTVDILR